MNRIFQRIPQINKELADLRRQLRRAQLGGKSPLLSKEGLGVVEKPKGEARGGQVGVPEAAPATPVAPEAPPATPPIPEAAAPAEAAPDAPANLPIAEEKPPEAPSDAEKQEEEKSAEKIDLKKASSFTELYSALDKLTEIKGTKRAYDAMLLKKIISGVRAGETDIGEVTRAGGLREVVESLLQKENDLVNKRWDDLKEGGVVKVLRSNGRIEDGWKILAKNPEGRTVTVYKEEDGKVKRKNIPAGELIEINRP